MTSRHPDWEFLQLLRMHKVADDSKNYYILPHWKEHGMIITFYTRFAGRLMVPMHLHSFPFDQQAVTYDHQLVSASSIPRRVWFLVNRSQSIANAIADYASILDRVTIGVLIAAHVLNTIRFLLQGWRHNKRVATALGG